MSIEFQQILSMYADVHPLCVLFFIVYCCIWYFASSNFYFSETNWSKFWKTQAQTLQIFSCMNLGTYPKETWTFSWEASCISSNISTMVQNHRQSWWFGKIEFSWNLAAVDNKYGWLYNVKKADNIQIPT